ncbi:MAG: DNA alkylation repair protein [Spirochaetales bacterium]|nr:DNA alkylation repair protein [Spirochaetales bacterium]
MLNAIERELREHIDFSYVRKTHLNSIRYKDYYGVRMSANREIAQKYYQNIEAGNKDDIFALCKKLLDSRIHEKKTIAFDWAFRLKDRYEKKDFYVFESWLYTYVNNYGLCDDLCTHALGEAVRRFPSCAERIYQWIKEQNIWVRRAGPVTLIYAAGMPGFLEMSLDVCRKLFGDQEPLVHKGFGWLLKELSQSHEKIIFDFLNTHKKNIPRIALRYAIEKMPKHKRQVVLNT